MQENNTNEFPSWMDQAKNLSELTQKILKDVAEGDNLFVDDFEQQRRLDICNACEYYHHHRSRCKKCGCYMKHKVTFKSSECPVEKWWDRVYDRVWPPL